MEIINPDETLDILCNDRLKIIQKKEGYRFSIDAIILANFVTLKKQDRVLDIGTGCGIIPIYMTIMGKTNKITGIEIQGELFELAEKNREFNRCYNVDFIKGDVTRIIDRLKDMRFQVIISNPPYTKEKSGRKSPGKSRLLARYESTLSLESLIETASIILGNKGRLYLIYPVRRLGELIYTAKTKRLEPKRIRFVHPRYDEKANLFLIELIKNSGIQMTVEKPLYIYEDIYYTHEIASYYQ
ncbi:MAG TPA: methyltransferase [Syntrophorhabdaceae bacterium]|nr:methyltransferase [Syntrophorhabdaceae bacterium]